MPTALIAYNAAREVIATLDQMVVRDDNGKVIGLVDFAAQEEQGELLDVWKVPDAAGSGTWPEWLGDRAHDFQVELDGPAGGKRIAALVHKVSGARRNRAAIEKAIAKRVKEAGDQPTDLWDLIGGPDRPLLLDDKGRTKARVPVQRPDLPIIGGR